MSWVNGLRAKKIKRKKQIKKLKRKIMNRGIGIALVVVGIVLIVYGFNASDSASSGISRIFTGAPTNKTLWLLLGGIGSTIVGAVMMLRPSGKV
jgi:ABC-type phosphate transport system permease subunit